MVVALPMNWIRCAALGLAIAACHPAEPSPSPRNPPAASTSTTVANDKGPAPPHIARGLADLWSRRSDDRVTTTRPPTEAAEPEPPVVEDPPIDEAALRQVLALLSPPASSRKAVLLLGVHTETVATYAPLYSAEPYPIDEAPGYRTLVLVFDDEGARVAADLPYLLVPQATGFAYYGEAEISIDEGFSDEVNEAGFAMPKTYVASEIVSASSAAALPAAIAAAKKRLRSNKEWGETDVESLLTITPRAECTEWLSAQVTGGALGFMATTRMRMRQVGTTPLARTKLTDAELQRFADLLAGEGVVGELKPDGTVNLDKPVDLWWRTLSWRKDVAMCPGRHAGRLQIIGSTQIPGNSARSFTVAYALGDAPPELGTQLPMPLDFAALEKAVPRLSDVFVTPQQDLAVLLTHRQLLVYDATGHVHMDTPLPPMRAVMAEWAEGRAADAWLARAQSK
jgi:hypothetical protein